MADKVIVIDDSSTIREQVRNVLSAAGFEVIEAVDGEDGLSVLERHADARVVICDINMPRMGGMAMLSRLKGKSLRRMPPVVVLTTEGDPELARKAKAEGAKVWIVKPFRPDLLLATVQKLAKAT